MSYTRRQYGKPQRPRFYAQPRFAAGPGTWGPESKVCPTSAEAVQLLVAAGVPGEVTQWSDKQQKTLTIALVYADGTVVDPRPAEGWGEKYGLTYEEYLTREREIRHAWVEHVRSVPKPESYPAVPGFDQACPKCDLHGHDPASCRACRRCGSPEFCTCKKGK